MRLRQQIDADIKSAMLSKDKEALEALRGIKSLILLAETEKGHEAGLAPEAEIKLLTKAAKQRKESADIFTREGRADLAQRELFQLSVINRYLPQQLTEAELIAELQKLIEAAGAKSVQDLGKVMALATRALAGKADGRLISEWVKKLLTN